jgi:heme A synthase
MDISIGYVIIVVLLFALMFWLVRAKVTNPNTKEILQVVIVIIAILLILNVLGIIGHPLRLHINNP